jgi:flagellar protein FlgJ
MVGSADLNNYNDLSALQSLKADSKRDSIEGIREVARQFESLFVSMMLKSMRQANESFSEGNMLTSQDSKFYQEMFDSQIAVSLAGERGIGLAQEIERQILSQKGMLPKDAAITQEMQISDYARKQFPAYQEHALQDAVSRIDKIVEETQSLKEPLKIGSEPGHKPDQSDLPQYFDNPKQFIESLYPIAKSVEQETGISARLMIAQSALETGWGSKPITRGDGSNSHNLFGIKANNDWEGDRADILTTEFRGGVAVKQRDAFRAYNSYQESFKDYANFLRENPRYEAAMDLREDPVAFAQALQSSGYATDPNYAAKIEQILSRRLPDENAVKNPFESVVR